MSEHPITFTDRAINHALSLAATTDAYRGAPLRIYLEGKGCDGFFYGVAFDEHLTDDITWQDRGLTIVVDNDTLEFVRGSEVDWVDDERGQGFLVENPRHKRFRGKFYKRQHWQDKLLAKKGLVRPSAD